MMSREDSIQEQLLRLEDQRKALAQALRQIAMQGEAYALPGVLSTRDHARKDIAQIKSTLRAWGVVVEDHPDDLRDRMPRDGSTISPHPASSPPDRRPVAFDQQGWTVQNVYNVTDPGGFPDSRPQPRADITPKRRHRWLTVACIVAVALMGLLLGPVVNYATAEPPPSWLAWMQGQWWTAFVVLAVLSLGITTWMAIREARSDQ